MLRKENRLSTTYEFNKVRRLGRKVRTPLFDLFYLDNKNPETPTRIGVVVSNKFSPVAPKRNRVKRIFREMLRLEMEKLPNGYWLVVHPNHTSVEKSHEEIRAEINKVLSKIPFSH